MHGLRERKAAGEAEIPFAWLWGQTMTMANQAARSIHLQKQWKFCVTSAGIHAVSEVAVVMEFRLHDEGQRKIFTIDTNDQTLLLREKSM